MNSTKIIAFTANARPRSTALISAAVCILVASCATSSPSPRFSFFVTSEPATNGGDLGGLSGADAICSRLATSAGSNGKEWRAYLSVTADGTRPAVHARDRIGTGPWYNIAGTLIANDGNELHAGAPKLNKDTALTELGKRVPGIGDEPVDHDILTGSQPDGTAFPPGQDYTCNGWRSDTEGFAYVGHVDRVGGRDGTLTSWNSAHRTRSCANKGFAETGGSGRLYCFASSPR